MSREHKYQTKLSWVGAGQGATSSYNSYSREYTVEIAGKAPFRGTADPMFRGDPTLHNPEDLLVASLAACHMLTYLALAAREQILIEAYEDTSSGTMILDGNGGRFQEVTLRPKVIVSKESDIGRATELHEKAHRDCFIANSVNFPVRHDPFVHTSFKASFKVP
ncbi:MAG: peroxiredoxin [Bdellovibrionales bacterium GWA2_49_15]|nr:MAG: peroxiredoxin [Bdellovibrionales bacterium GWA2_49_15]HAZ13390.1 peroxiredoxin [Bdellovibrionales bacterium]